MGFSDWMLLVALSAVWSSSFFAYKFLDIEYIPPFTIVLGRVTVGAITLLSIVRLMGQRMPSSPRIWAAFFVMGALNNAIPFSLIVFGETQIDSGTAAILNALTPIFTVLIAHVTTSDERLTGGKVAGVVLGILGVIALIGPHELTHLNLASLAQIAVIAAAALYACAGIFGRRFKTMGVTPIVTAAGQLCASTLLMIAPVLFVDQPWSMSHAPTTAGWAVWLGLAILGTGVAYVWYFRILESAGATNLMLVTFLIPIGALLLGSFILGERLTWPEAAGMFLIFAGVIAIDGRVWLHLRRVALVRFRSVSLERGLD